MKITLHKYHLFLLLTTLVVSGCLSPSSHHGRSAPHLPPAPQGDGEVRIRFVNYCPYEVPARIPYSKADDAKEYLRGHKAGWLEMAGNYTIVVSKGTISKSYTRYAAKHLGVSQAFQSGHSDGIRAAAEGYLGFERTVSEHYRDYVGKYLTNKWDKGAP